MRHLIISLLAVAALVGVTACGDDETTTTSTVTEDAPVTTDATGGTAETTTEDSTGDDTTGEDETGDVSGNCDEAEHADDPECTGGIGAGDDSSGSGSGY